ncbi:MAG: tetratricopeptide repeat protein [Candidatus Omnitrophota bacterium]|nr:tetratricopeptide repeat protein [Candidatus Omnitrophota bacterium]
MKKALIIAVLLSFLISSAVEARNVQGGWTSRKKPRREKTLKRREVEKLYRQAEEHFLSNDYRQAIAKFEKVIYLHFHSRYADDALLLSGVSYLKEKEWSKARENLNRLLSDCPRSSLTGQARLSLADSFYLSGDLNQAVSRYKQFLIDNPHGPLLAEVYFKLGRCYREKGRWDEARYYFEKVYADYPLSFEAGEASVILTKDKLYFTVQVGSFVNKTNALNACARLKNKGYQAFLRQVREKGRLLYRVRVGNFDTRGEADYIAVQLNKDGYSTKIYP